MELSDPSSNTSKETFIPGAQPPSEIARTQIGHPYRVAAGVPAQGRQSAMVCPLGHSLPERHRRNQHHLSSCTDGWRNQRCTPPRCCRYGGNHFDRQRHRSAALGLASDAVGRPSVFLIMFLLQAALFFFLPAQRDFAILVTLAFVILSCYGGGFGTM